MFTPPRRARAPRRATRGSRPERPDLRALHQHGRVDVTMLPAVRADRDSTSASSAISRRPRRRVGVGEVHADVAEPGRAEQCVHDRVRQHVGVGVPVQAQLGVGESTPPRISGRPASKRCESEPRPVRSRGRSSDRLQPALAPAKTAISVTPCPVVRSTAASYSWPRCRACGRRWTARRGSRPPGSSQEGRRGIQLPDRLAQAGGGHLHRHLRLVTPPSQDRRSGAGRLGQRPPGPQILIRSGCARMSKRPERAASPSVSK